MHPWEWRLLYRDTPDFPRVLDGFARLAAWAPRTGLLGLVLTGGPGGRVRIPAPLWIPEEIVLRASMLASLSDPRTASVTGWRAGFRRGSVFSGVTIALDGRVTWWRPRGSS